MKFTFKKYFCQLLLIYIILNLFIILMSILWYSGRVIHIFFTVIMLVVLNKNLVIELYRIKKFIKENTIEKIKKLEHDLSDNYLIYDDWYLTDEYMFSVRILKEINYKDIIVVEDGFALVNGSGHGSTLGDKQTIYLKNGEKYKLKSQFMSGYATLFTDFIKQKNSSVYFGIIEDYLKIKKDTHF